MSKIIKKCVTGFSIITNTHILPMKKGKKTEMTMFSNTCMYSTCITAPTNPYFHNTVCIYMYVTQYPCPRYVQAHLQRSQTGFYVTPDAQTGLQSVHVWRVEGVSGIIECGSWRDLYYSCSSLQDLGAYCIALNNLLLHCPNLVA